MKLSDFGIDLPTLATSAKNATIAIGTDFASSAIESGISKIIAKNQSGIHKFMSALGVADGMGYSANSYAKAVELGDPLLDWEFSVIMPAISAGSVSAPALAPFYIEDIDIPMQGFSAEEMKVNGQPVKVLGFPDLGDCTLSIYGDYKTVAQNYVNAWYASMQTRAGRYNLPFAPNNVGYKKMINVIIYKGSVPVLMASLSGVMPTSRDGLSFKSANNGRIIYSQTLSVDRVYLTQLYADSSTTVADLISSPGKVLGNSVATAVSNGISQSTKGFF